jgi:D-lactate dehydrogenase (cytochrome)
MSVRPVDLDALRTLCRSRSIEFIDDQPRLLRDYGTDRSFHTPSAPSAAMLPSSPDDVAEIVKLCAQRKITMTPRGAGSGLEGGCIPYSRGVVIDTSLIRSFRLDRSNGICWVGAGMRKMELNKQLNKEGLLFGPDPASNPSVGGMASTSGSGMSTLKYGTTRENVVSLLVVTPQGHLIQTRRAVRKASSGLDLTQLYIGSEGTLGIIVEVCVKVHPLLRERAGGIITFASSSDAVNSVVTIKTALSAPLPSLVRCELLNAGGVAAANQAYSTTLAVAPTVLVELFDSTAAQLARDFNALSEIFQKHHATSMNFITKADELDAVWEARRGCLMAASMFRRCAKNEKVLNTDVCVPITELSRTVCETEEDFRQAGFPCLICAHIADGNFHCMIPFTNKADEATARQLERRVVERAIRAGGTCSGEHGVGIGKVKFLTLEHGEAHIKVQEAIKAALDPDDIMNPGTFYPVQQARWGTAHL